MENREEIKASVKNKLIELMTEQIAKETDFEKLKAELIAEVLHLEEKQPEDRHLNSNLGYDPINEAEALYKKEMGFLYNKDAVKKRFENFVKEENKSIFSSRRPVEKYEEDLQSKVSRDKARGGLYDKLLSIKDGEMQKTFERYLKSKPFSTFPVNIGRKYEKSEVDVDKMVETLGLKADSIISFNHPAPVNALDEVIGVDTTTQHVNQGLGFTALSDLSASTCSTIGEITVESDYDISNTATIKTKKLKKRPAKTQVRAKKKSLPKTANSKKSKSRDNAKSRKKSA